MTIQTGEKMPSGVFGVMTDAGPGAISSDELFGGKKVVLVSVPGAFTPTCSASHLPGFVQQADELLDDVFVMHAWGEDQNVGDKVMMLADGNGEYAKALDLEMDGTAFGMGTRAQRFAIIVDDGTATHVAVEAPGKLDVSKAESILAEL
jgi:peroxiredoxin